MIGMKRTARQYPFHIEHIQLPDGAVLAYADEGQGPPLLLIHGLSSYMPVWQHNLPELKKNYRVLALDLPGYGLSSLGSTAVSLQYYVEVVHQLLAHLQVSSAHLVGHSMGGQVAMLCCIRYPYLVDRLVLVAPAGLEPYNPREQELMHKQFSQYPLVSVHLMRAMNRVVGHRQLMGDTPMLNLSDVVCQSPDPRYNHTLAASIASMLRETVHPYLAQVARPTLICFGTDDGLIPNPLLHGGDAVSIGKAAATRMPAARLQVFEGCGHFLQYEAPALFNSIVVEFLQGK